MDKEDKKKQNVSSIKKQTWKLQRQSKFWSDEESSKRASEQEEKMENKANV